jgi:membrane protein implicated in regulation of membrane protease activity
VTRLRMPRRALVAGLLGAPTLWLVHFGLSYLLVTLACAGHLPAARAWLLAVTAAAVGAATWLGARAGRRLRSPDRDRTDGAERLLALGAVWLTVGFGLVLVLEGVSFVAQTWWCGSPG